MALPNITATGNIVADPELRFFNDGNAVVNFRIACNGRKKNRETGQWENGDTTFLTCSAFNGLAENIEQQFGKGKKITVAGQLKQREYEKDGQKRTVFEVTVNEASEPVAKFNNNDGPQGGFSEAQGNVNSVMNNDTPPF
ncbi:single-stranded DNA-binding protein [Corynebacterium phoceense]|uniref:single-stranded DNA-binding protein n=1 Tax=Corynebacterium phoceense TaxID=1686286 RepID=UPI00211B7DD6|nr:single-stranded DNA-binding protein [Corynebacterium phoceense]MCQ9340837.1 single-stranded DNA-binding protein [Corynebacterium phoceense]